MQCFGPSPFALCVCFLHPPSVIEAAIGPVERSALRAGVCIPMVWLNLFDPVES